MARKLTQSDFAQRVKELAPTTFITCASFEPRCVEIANVVSQENREICSLIFYVDKESDASVKYRDELSKKHGHLSQQVRLEISNPLASSDSILRSITSLKTIDSKVILVDISTFTHEHLAMLVRALNSHALLSVTHFAYAGVKTYGINPHDSDEPVWLSKGAASVRSIVGFPGMLRPSRAVHCIALVGFEFERIRVALDESEPQGVSLGVGQAIESISQNHYRENKRFYEKVADFIEEKSAHSGSIESFEFSCVDPQKTKQKILEIAEKHKDRNIVVFPMNTKLSTLGAISAALEKPSIQLGYVEPLEYNIKNYSAGTDGFRLVSANEFTNREDVLSSLFKSFIKIE